MSNPKPEPKRDPNRVSGSADDNGGANDNRGKAVAPATKASALASTSLASLSAMLGNVIRSATGSRTNQPILSFRSREGGIWTIGTRRILVELGSCMAINFDSIEHGYIAFDDNNNPVGEKLVPGNEPKPDFQTLPDVGYPWHEQIAVDVKFISGSDAGAEPIYKPTTVGGRNAILDLAATTLNRTQSEEFDGKKVPIVRIGHDSYIHPKHGRIWTPVLELVDWMSPDGPAPTLTPPPSSPNEPQAAQAAPAAAEQPRRRRVA
jgi:hypothetical protein